MRTSLLSLAGILLLPITGLAATAQIDVTYLNGFGLGSNPNFTDNQGGVVQNGAVFQIVLWGNVGLTPADAGWDWGDYQAIAGAGSMNTDAPNFDTRLVNVPGTNGQALISQSVVFSNGPSPPASNLPPMTEGGNVGLVLFQETTPTGPSNAVYAPGWIFPSFPASGASPPLAMNVDAEHVAGNLVWQGNAFQIPEPSSGLLALIGALFLARRRR